jgi:hypothetical protein
MSVGAERAFSCAADAGGAGGAANGIGGTVVSNEICGLGRGITTGAGMTGSGAIGNSADAANGIGVGAGGAAGMGIGR